MRRSQRSLVESARALAWHVEAMRLRVEGLAYTEIAERLGLSVSTVHEGLAKYMRDLPAEAAESMRHVEAARLDGMTMAIYPAATSGDLAAIDRVLRIADRRAKMFGLDAAQAIDVTTTAASASPAEAARLVREAFASNVTRKTADDDASDPRAEGVPEPTGE